MTSKLHEGTVSSSINASNWVGTVFITPLLGAYITERYLGRFLALAIFCCIYTLGTGIMTLSVSLKSLRPKQCPINEDCQKASPLQNGIFFLGLYLIALGSGGTRPNICAFGADQFDDSVPKEKQLKNSFFNWWVLIVFSGGLFGQTVIVYIQDKMDWGVGNGIITAALVASCFLLLIRTPVYRHKIEPGRPLQRIVKVICTMFQNWKVPVPADPSSLHEVDSKEYVPEDRYLIAHTTHLRLLDKAAIQNGAASNPCTVTDVEETKLVIQILRIWVTAIFPSTLLIQAGTLFVKQAMSLDRKLGHKFEFPAASIGAFVPISMLLSLIIYNKLLVPVMRRFTGNPRGITILQRMGIGMLIHTVAMITAMVIEMRRLDVVKDHGLADQKHAIVPISIFSLLPQFVIMGIAESFIEVAKLEFFYDQAPMNMQSLGSVLYAASVGVGAFVNSVLLTVISSVTGHLGHKSWILDNVNASRFDYYYAVLALVNFMNYLVFLIMAALYTNQTETVEASERDSSNTEENAMSNPSYSD
ncbi:protein NRT1/ PTR FAMILY 5.2 isoform X2 [Cryptomeria japonica]|nr:protein NRT1/ PTR FAMILY 5.2 isoform X2 [Cryptomeria japonica]